MLGYHRLRLMGRCWTWGLAPSWPEQGQDSFSPTLLINGTLIQGCITLCCSLCSHAQPLFHTQCMSPALGRTVSDVILLIQCLMISWLWFYAAISSLLWRSACNLLLWRGMCWYLPLLSLPPSPLIPHSCTCHPPRFPSIRSNLSACALSPSLKI